MPSSHQRACGLLLLLLLCSAGGISAQEEDEYEFIEMPSDVSWEEGARGGEEDSKAQIPGASITIQHPPEGHTFADDSVDVRFEVHGVPFGEDFSLMVYFGSQNPIPMHLTHQSFSVHVDELAPGNYTVRVVVLDPDRRPTAVEASSSFSRTGQESSHREQTYRDVRAFEMSVRTTTWDSA
eukprot:CAMPEP_0173455162 /NCGR_PEP_ID=MMETSP1357-20121228/53762_1 /TAXON_ID=77926 /ORGANISM="Hemiselmis rufescens, Strain PCC563" /LENGTH=180 /DNA_ID=CAMNT_0014422263 /DNA_START=263 /DNA_END=802 /DNA_ORIENTATION=-